ncbi:hypothetical protein HUU05_29355 [candidate division KSB1 bacterium]|nr:hypothetical protein [candidate division KSB1 bacterium]
MSFLSFNDLQIGQHVKVSGKFREGEGFLAVEITPETSGGEAEMTCAVQSVAGRRLRVCGCEIAVPEDLEIKDLDGNRLAPSALKTGTMLKLKGLYEEGRGFTLKKLKLRDTLEFNIDEMQGVIVKLDREKKTLRLNGVPVWTNAMTVFDDGEN